MILDLSEPLWIDQVATLDLKRTFLFTLLGLVLVGPTLHFWYLYLSKLVTLPGASGAFLRLLLDQFIFSPIFIGVFLIYAANTGGKARTSCSQTSTGSEKALHLSGFLLFLLNWQLWIPFQFLNFRFVPQQFQV
ncbi:hypothetical protein Patl1_21064 [Pistacia atlantica]|uniref:Uncharacterized protein n=1 Tax=Pistacia atlantica TaxID=434234 RepID=A0ACC1BL13_9ROSI|nr:hypothetical protein Patl1_21064 [Pistacia atlantica]